MWWEVSLWRATCGVRERYQSSQKSHQSAMQSQCSQLPYHFLAPLPWQTPPNLLNGVLWYCNMDKAHNVQNASKSWRKLAQLSRKQSTCKLENPNHCHHHQGMEWAHTGSSYYSLPQRPILEYCNNCRSSCELHPSNIASQHRKNSTIQ